MLYRGHKDDESVQLWEGGILPAPLSDKRVTGVERVERVVRVVRTVGVVGVGMWSWSSNGDSRARRARRICKYVPAVEQ